MVRTHRFLTTLVLVCFVMAQSRGALAADEQPPLPSTASTSALAIDAVASRQEATSAIDVVADEQPLDRELSLYESRNVHASRSPMRCSANVCSRE